MLEFELLQSRGRGPSRLEAADWVVVAIYFLALITTGMISSLRNRGSIGGYFLAGQNANWVVVGASLFASNIGSGHFVGLAGTAAKTGIAVSAFELHAVFTLALLGWFFLPVYRATGVFTLPEYMFKRFGGTRIRIYLAVMSLMLYVFTKISADLYSGALFMDQALPGQANLYVWVTVLVVVAAVFTITGGLTAVMWTDTLQTVIMLIGAFVLMVLSFQEVGGYKEMKRKYPLALADTTIINSGNTSYQFRSCGRPKKGWFKIMLPADDPELPWTGVVFGLTVNAVWYWCTDQVIVQRALAAKNMVHGKMGCVMASYLKVLPMWLIVFPGMIARILYPNDVACNELDTCERSCQRESGCHDIAYPLLVVRLMPVGVRGLMLSVMMSALISSLTSVFNSISTIFTIDVWQRLRKNPSDMELMLVGRVAVMVLIVISIIWIPVVKNSSLLFQYIQQMTAYLGSSVCAAFVLAVFWNRTTETAVFWGLIIGTLSGLVRGFWSTVFLKTAPCGVSVESKPSDVVITEVNYLHFAAINYVFTTLVIVAISYFAPVPDVETYAGKTFFTRHARSVTREAAAQEQQETPNYLTRWLGDKAYEEQPWHIRVLLWVCGVDEMLRKQDSAAAGKINRNIFEEKRLSYLMHANMIMAMVFISCYWTFYSL